MNDERFLKDWLRDTTTDASDPQASADQILARLPHARQRSRWWPLLPGRRRTPHDDTPPTVTGRTMFMFSPIKAISAGALVFALGGMFLIAQPFGQQGESAPGADSGDVAATWVTGDIYAPGSDCSWPLTRWDGAVRHEWGYHCEPQEWTTSDPRLSGDVAALWNADVYEEEEHGPISVITAAYFVTNEAGGWTCRSDTIAIGSGLDLEYVPGETATCVGDGDYEGLSATLALDYVVEESLVGLIFPGDAPPFPEQPAAE
jgi:hypothetical protein